MKMIFETHGHYDDEQFDTDREQLLEEFQRQDIRYVMNIGANIATSKASVELAHQYDFIYAAIGTHPDDAPELSDAAIEMPLQAYFHPHAAPRCCFWHFRAS